MKVQLVIPYLVSHLQRSGVTARGNVTSVYPPLYQSYTDERTTVLLRPEDDIKVKLLLYSTMRFLMTGQ